MSDLLKKLGTYLKKQTLSPLHLVLLTYLLLLLSRLLGENLLTRENTYLTTVVLQMLIFMLPAAIYLKLRGEKLTTALKLSRPAPSHLLITLSASLMLICVGTLLGVLLGTGNENGFTLYDTFTLQTDGSAAGSLYLILAYALLPALGEEIIYRAILCAEYEKHGALTAISVSSLFFALLHFHLQNLPIYLIAGAILGLLFYATKSILAPIVAHFLYNLFGLFGMPSVSAFYRITGDVGIFLFLVGALLLIASVFFAGEAAKLYGQYAKQNYDSSATPALSRKALKKALIHSFFDPVAMICYILYIIVMIANLIR